MNTWPKKLFDFAFIPLSPTTAKDNLQELCDLAEDEDWGYHHIEPGEHDHPVLYHYIKSTYERVAEEDKIGLSEDGQFACFNTGLVTNNQEPIFASFEKNRIEGKMPWYFKSWFRKGRWELNKFPKLPDMANYFDDPSCLVLDHRRDFRVNVEHIIKDNPRERFPAPYREMNDYALGIVLDGVIDKARERVRRSYKTAIPQYYRGKVQLLLPLCLSNPRRADVALVVENNPTFYRASTCLTLEMAYNNARQLARPDRDWLQP